MGGIAQWPNHHVDESEGNRDAPTRNEALEAKGDGCNDRYSAREEDEDVAEREEEGFQETVVARYLLVGEKVFFEQGNLFLLGRESLDYADPG